MGTVVTTKPRKKAEPKKKGNSPYNIGWLLCKYSNGNKDMMNSVFEEIFKWLNRCRIDTTQVVISFTS